MKIISQFAAVLAICLAMFLAHGAWANPSFWQGEWPNTDFENTSIGWSEIRDGGPPKDGIPALSDPSFIPVASESRIGGREPVITVELEGAEPRAYPVRYLTWHEIVNDEVAGIPIAVTFCPLCNSGLVFDRRVKGALRTFGVSGKLRNSDMVMYDRETESWWQQAVGQGIVGVHNGDQLIQLPAWMESWDEYRSRNPDGLVMDEPNWNRNYGNNPYVSYDSSTKPFLYNGEHPPHDIPALMRVVRIGDEAWTFDHLRRNGTVETGEATIVWTAGQASALDSSRIGEGKDVGTVRVRDANGQNLPHDVMFAFAFHAFWPDGTWHYD